LELKSFDEKIDVFIGWLQKFVLVNFLLPRLPYNLFRADIFSFGVLMIEFIYQNDDHRVTPLLIEKLTQNPFHSLILSCLQNNPSDRKSLKELLQITERKSENRRKRKVIFQSIQQTKTKNQSAREENTNSDDKKNNCYRKRDRRKR